MKETMQPMQRKERKGQFVPPDNSQDRWTKEGRVDIKQKILRESAKKVVAAGLDPSKSAWELMAIAGRDHMAINYDEARKLIDEAKGKK